MTPAERDTAARRDDLEREAFDRFLPAIGLSVGVAFCGGAGTVLVIAYVFHLC